MRVLIFCAILISGHAAPLDKTMKSAMTYLKTYGYISNNTSENEEAVKMGIAKFQSFMGLNQTNNMNDDTFKAMNRLRCGEMDFVPGEHTRIFNNSQVYYKIVEYPHYKKTRRIDELMQLAFNLWSKYINVGFSTRRKAVQLTVMFARGEHGDQSPFDGAGNQAAHEAPTSSSTRVIHFDSDEEWDVYQDDNFVKFYNVAAHEIGHSLGLHHINSTDSIMHPMYQHDKDFSRALHPVDIEIIQKLYPNSKSEQPMDKCNRVDKFDTVFTRQNSVYFIKDAYYIEYDLGMNLKSHGRVDDKWKNLPQNIDAAFESRFGQMFFFKGNQIWMYSESELAEGYPTHIYKKLPGIPANVESAFLWNGKLHIFHGLDYYIYYSKETSGPFKIAENWGYTSQYSKGAINIMNQTLIIFKINTYYIYNDQTKSISVTHIRNILPCNLQRKYL